MANKAQINCVLDNKLTTQLLKREWINLDHNIKEIKNLENELIQIESLNPIKMPLQDIRHPYHNQYMANVDLIQEFKKMVKLNQTWIRIYKEQLSRSTC